MCGRVSAEKDITVMIVATNQNDSKIRKRDRELQYQSSVGFVQGLVKVAGLVAVAGRLTVHITSAL